jgi:tRNA G18 (ribose-2'-O)-methylase SpoU
MTMVRPTNVVQVTSLDQTDLLPYRTLRRPESHIKQGIFVAEGNRVVRRLLNSGLNVVSLLLTPDWLERFSGDFDWSARDEIRIFVADLAVLSAIVGFNLHQGVMAVGRVPPEPDLAEIPVPHLVVALDSLRMSENVGTIVRNCAAFAVDAIVVGETSCSPYMRRAVRNSMGAVFRMRVIHTPSLAVSLESLKLRFGTKILVTDPSARLAFYDADLTGNVCLVLGSEDSGVSPDIRRSASTAVAIPMCEGTDSLNVASASAVFLSEAIRQRRGALHLKN